MNLYDFYQPRKPINLTENMISANDVESKYISENLHKWFKEKWVRFGPDGKIRGDCARGDDSEGKPKCLPRAKAHALGKKGRKYAAAKKRREDPNPERSGPAINVRTKKKKVSEEYDADPNASNVPQYKTWGDAAKAWSQSRKADTVANKIINHLPVVGQVASALDTGAAAIQGDYKGAGRSALGILPATKKIDTALSMADTARKVQSGEIDPVKTLKGVLPQSETPIDEDQAFTFTPEQEKWLGNANRQDPNIIARMPGPKPPPSYFTNPQDQQAAQKMQQTQDLASRWQAFRQGNKVANSIINRIPGVGQAAAVADVGAKLSQGDLYGAGRQAIGMIPGARDINTALQAKDVATNLASGNIADAGMGALGIAAGQGSKTAADIQKATKVATRGAKVLNYLGNQSAQQNSTEVNESNKNSHGYKCPHCGGKMFSEELINEKKDACYYKVKSRYKVWPSAYASGALVKCRKRGAKNWGSKSESVISEADRSQSQTFNQAFAAARAAAAAQGDPSTGTFTWKDPKTGKVGTYQTNVAGEKYVSPAQQRPVGATTGPAAVRSAAVAPASGVRAGPNANIDDATRARARAAVAAATTPAATAAVAAPASAPASAPTVSPPRSTTSDILGGLAPGEFSQRMAASAPSAQVEPSVTDTGDETARLARRAPASSVPSAQVEPSVTDTGDETARLARRAPAPSASSAPAPTPSASSAPAPTPSASSAPAPTPSASSASAPAPAPAASASSSAAGSVPSATSSMRGRMPRVGTDFYYVPGGNITDTGDETARLARRAPAPTPSASAPAPTPSAPAAAAPTARPITDRERESMAAANAEPETGFVPGTTGFTGSGETPDQAGAAIERPAAAADTTSEPGVSVSSDDLSPETRQSFKPSAISPRVAYNFASQNNNVKIDQSTLNNAINLGLVDSTGKPDKEAIENWQRNNKLKVDGIIGPNTSASINQKITGAVTSPSGAAIQSGTPGVPVMTPNYSGSDFESIQRNDLSPSQRAALGSAATSMRADKVPLPSWEELGPGMRKAETGGSYDMAFKVTDPKYKNIIPTPEQWSQKNLGSSKPMTQWTIAQAMKYQQDIDDASGDAKGSFNAIGGYGFMKSVLKDYVNRLAKEGKLDPNKTLFDAKTQDLIKMTMLNNDIKSLTNAGIVPNPVNIYMSNTLGPGGAIGIHRDMRTPDKLVIDSMLDTDARTWPSVFRRENGRNPTAEELADRREQWRKTLLRGNPFMADMKVGEYYDYSKAGMQGNRSNSQYEIRSRENARNAGLILPNGKQNKEAIETFQKLNNLPVSGRLDTTTRSRINLQAASSGRKLGETVIKKHYFNIVGTDRRSLITEFKMQKDARGWYLPNSAKSSLKLDAVRAFGIPLTEEEMNQASYSGTAATLGVDNPKSPIGSISKSQRLNKRSRSK